MNLKIKEVIHCDKCDDLSRLNTIKVKDNKVIIANYLCKCSNSTNIIVEWIDIISEKELQRKTIRDLLKELANVDKNKVIITDICNKPYIENSFGSDRGIYSSMYISTTNDKSIALTVEGLIKLLNRALHEGIMYGYKGGEINIYEDTYTTLGEYGEIGFFITNIQENDDYVKIISETNI